MLAVASILPLALLSNAVRVPNQDGLFFNPTDDDNAHSSPGQVLSRDEQIIYAASEVEYYAYQIQFDPVSGSTPEELPQCPDGQVSLPSDVPSDYDVGITKRGFFKKLFRPLKGAWDKFRKKITPQQRPRFNVCNVDRIAVDVIFHWHNSQQPVDFNFTDNRIARQIAAVNTVYNPHGISFTYRPPMRLRVASDHPDPYDRNSESPTRSATREGGRRTLNVWVTRNILIEGSTTDICYGFSRFPEAKSSDDGITIDHRSFIDEDPSTRIANTSLGMGGVLMHEIGHWMGLKHSFAPDQQACSEFVSMSEATYRQVNDGLSDTPMLPGEREVDTNGNTVHWNCRQPTCVRGGMALPYSFQNNFMSYSDCLGMDLEPANWNTAPTPTWRSQGFTAQQRARMFAAFAYFRAFEGITRRTDCKPYDERTRRDLVSVNILKNSKASLQKREEIGFSTLADPDLLANLQNEELVCVPDVKDAGEDPGDDEMDPGTGTPGDGTDNTDGETDPGSGTDQGDDPTGGGTSNPDTGAEDGGVGTDAGSDGTDSSGSTPGDGAGETGDTMDTGNPNDLETADDGEYASEDPNDASVGNSGDSATDGTEADTNSDISSASSTTSSDTAVYTGDADATTRGSWILKNYIQAVILSIAFVIS